MKKSKLISLLLAVAMVMSMIVLPAGAVEETAATPVALDSAVCPAHPEEAWTEIEAGTWTGGALESGHYRLTGDQATTSALTIAAGANVCIDLNGYNITAGAKAGKKNYRAIENAGVLTVMDLTATGMEDTYKAGIISGGALHSQGSSDASNKTGYGGNILNTGTFTLHSGIIADGYLVGGAYDNGDLGANICSQGGVLNIQGGVVRDGINDRTSQTGTAQGGGNIYTKNAEVNITGGYITGGKIRFVSSNKEATYSSSSTTSDRKAYLRGGNLYTVGGTLHIENAVISDGYIKQAFSFSKAHVVIYLYGGNVYIEDATTTIKNAVIRDGYVEANATGAKYPASSSLTDSHAYAIARGGNLYFIGENKTLTIEGNTSMTGGTTIAKAAKHTSSTDTKEPLLLTYSEGSDCFVYNAKAVSVLEGNVSEIGLGKSANMTVLGGAIGNLIRSNTATGTVVFYNAVTAFDPTAYVAECATMQNLDTIYVVRHAPGANCEKCGHDYVAAAGEACDAAACGVVHDVSKTCRHTFVEGVCSVCSFAAPEHTATCKTCGEVIWTCFNGTIEAGGHYFLAHDVQLLKQIDATNKDICIDLNGYTLTAPLANRALYNSKSDITLMDSSAEKTGRIRGLGMAYDKNGGLIYTTGGSLYAYDITMADGVACDERGGNLYVNGGICVLENVKILNGRCITGTTAGRGGNICNYSGTVILKGADTLVYGGRVETSSGNSYGGNYYSGTGGDLYVYDGVIAGGYAKGGSNLCIMNGTADKGWNSVNVVYGGEISTVDRNASGTNISIYGGSSYDNELYILGGKIGKITCNSGVTDGLLAFNGTFTSNPRTAAYNSKTAVAECAAVTQDAETGLYTVSHINSQETCRFCSGNDAGFAKGYGDAHIYENVVTGVVAATNGTAYAELPAALEAAKDTSNKTILFADANVAGYVDVYSALELNGYNLTATGVVDASNSNGSIADSVGTSTVAAEEVILGSHNGQLGITTEEGMVFETVQVVQRLEQLQDAEGNPYTRIKFFINESSEDTKLDDAIIAEVEERDAKNRAVKVKITVTWEKDGVAGTHSYLYTADLVDQYVAGFDRRVFTCDIRGLEDLGTYEIVAEVESNLSEVQAIAG